MASGWFADPLGRHEKRFFSGLVWTDRVLDGEHSGSDPIGGIAHREQVGGGVNRTGSVGTRTFRATPKRGNGAAVTALALGLAGAVVALVVPFGFVVGAACGFAALVVGMRAYRSLTGNGETPNALATSGLVLGGVALVVAAYLGASYFSVPSTVRRAFAASTPTVTANANRTQNQVVITNCYRATEGSPAATGTLVNRSDKRQAYSVTIEFRGGPIAVQSNSLTVPLEPGATGSWTVRDIMVSFKPTSCRVVTPRGVKA